MNYRRRPRRLGDHRIGAPAVSPPRSATHLPRRDSSLPPLAELASESEDLRVTRPLICQAPARPDPHPAGRRDRSLDGLHQGRQASATLQASEPGDRRRSPRFGVLQMTSLLHRSIAILPPAGRSGRLVSHWASLASYGPQASRVAGPSPPQPTHPMHDTPSKTTRLHPGRSQPHRSAPYPQVRGASASQTWSVRPF